MDFSVTIFYWSLETISSCHLFFSAHLKSEQCEQPGAKNIYVARNRLLGQFRAQYPEHDRERIANGLFQGNSQIRVIFATVAFGIGLDIANI